LTSKSAERWVRDGQTLTDLLIKNGYKIDLQYADMQPQIQVQQIEDMITKGCKALIIAPVDNGALSSVLKDAKDSGILVINYDLGIIGSSDIDYFVGFDNSKVGGMQARCIIDKLGLEKGAKGPFIIELFAGSLAEANCYMYFNGAMELLQPYIDKGILVVKSGQTDINVVTVEGWRLELLAARLDNLLTTYYSDGSRIDAVLCPVDYLAAPIATRLIEAGYGTPNMPMPIITGNDATEAVVRMIAHDQITMTVFKDTNLLAEACISILNAVEQGQKPAVNGEYTPDKFTIPTIFVEMAALDKSNLDKLVIQSGFYSRAQIY
jgi:putative multiple sugar transport system substrate-binding protein